MAPDIFLFLLYVGSKSCLFKRLLAFDQFAHVYKCESRILFLAYYANICRLIGYAMRRETQNVIQLSVGFMFFLIGWNTSLFVRNLTISAYAQRGLVHPHAGYWSLAITYVAAACASLISARVINWLGARRAFRLFGGTFAIWMVQFLVGVREWLLYVASAAIGAMCACE